MQGLGGPNMQGNMYGRGDDRSITSALFLETIDGKKNKKQSKFQKRLTGIFFGVITAIVIGVVIYYAVIQQFFL